MAEAATATSSSGSDVGSPAAGAVAPATARQRMSDLGTAGAPPAAARGRMSDLGTVSQGEPIPQGPPPERMVPIKNPFGEPANEVEPPQRMQPLDPEAEPKPDAEQPEQQAQTPDGALTPEQIVAKYAEWMDSDQIPEEFLDRPIWVQVGKDQMMPIRLRDVPQNVMLYNDYQRKTTEIAAERRQIDNYKAGRERWVEDMVSGDGQRGMRALRALGADKTLHAIVVNYVQQMAELEGLPPALREQFIRKQQIEDRAWAAENELRALKEQQQRAEQERLQNEGVNAPEVKYVQDSIAQQLPELYRQHNVIESPLFDQVLSEMLAQAATGERNPDGTWRAPPTIQLGRAPTRSLLSQIVVAAKQKADYYMSTPQARGLKRPAPPPTAPISGSGPAAQPGQPGNISHPQRARFSDLAERRR
jgi:hypothetical protein